jgi:FKBP-type peptidyl-prolyl cis-trans isomerase
VNTPVHRQWHRRRNKKDKPEKANLLFFRRKSSLDSNRNRLKKVLHVYKRKERKERKEKKRKEKKRKEMKERKKNVEVLESGPIQFLRHNLTE